MPSDHSESPTPKKQRVIDPSVPLQSPSNGHLSSTGRASIVPRNSSLPTKLEFDRMSSSIQDSQNGLYPRHNHSHGEPNGTPKPERLQPDGPVTESPKPPRTDPPVCTEQPLANGQHKKKKSKKHKDKEREHLKTEWVETSPDLKHHQENLSGRYNRILHHALYLLLPLPTSSFRKSTFALIAPLLPHGFSITDNSPLFMFSLILLEDLR